MRNILLALASILLPTSSLADETPQQIVSDYIGGYSAGVDTSELVKTYWLSTLVVFSVEAPPRQLSSDAFAEIVHQFREQVREAGWLRTEIVEIEQCEVREDLAIVSLRYKRVFSDGKEPMDAVTYTLTMEDKWRISAVMPTDPRLMVVCKESTEDDA